MTSRSRAVLHAGWWAPVLPSSEQKACAGHFPATPPHPRSHALPCSVSPQADFRSLRHQAPAFSGFPPGRISRSPEDLMRGWVFSFSVLSSGLLVPLPTTLSPLGTPSPIALSSPADSSTPSDFQEGVVMTFLYCWSLGATSPLLGSLSLHPCKQCCINLFKGALCFLLAEIAPRFPFESLPLSHGIEVVGHHNQGAQPFLSQEGASRGTHSSNKSRTDAFSLGLQPTTDQSHFSGNPTKRTASNSQCSDAQSCSGG